MTRDLHDGREDGLQPLESFDIAAFDGLCRHVAADVADGFRRTRTGRSLRCALGHGGRPRLHDRRDRLRRHDHRQDGPRAVRDDRRLAGTRDRQHRRDHLPRAVGEHRRRALQARSEDLRRATLSLGLQPGLRHGGNGGESAPRAGPDGSSARRLGLVEAGLLLGTEPGDRPPPVPTEPDAQHPRLRLSAKACRSTCRR